MRFFSPNVPPLYSLLLIPFYIINSDARMFYFANILLSLASLVFLYKVLTKLTLNKWIIGFSTILFVTNYYSYWYPQWAMAENIMPLLFLLGLLLLISEINKKNIVLASFITISFYAAKYAYAPIMVGYGLLFFIKILWENKTNFHELVNTLLLFLLLTTIFLIPLFWYGYKVSGINPFSGLISILSNFIPRGYSNQISIKEASGSWFSFYFIKMNLPRYLKAVVGTRERFLWDFTPIIHNYIGWIGVFGLFGGLFIKNFRYASFSIILLVGIEIVFLSSFYAVDMRYLYFLIPILILGFALFWSGVSNCVSRIRIKNLIFFSLFLVSIIYLFGNVIRLKKQIMLNIKYAETPWYYISVLKLNEYFSVRKTNMPIVISPMPPYYIDFYSNGNYELLPLYRDQEFRNHKYEAWGENDYSDMTKLYKKYLSSGKELYLSTYGLGNEKSLHNAFDAVKRDFILSEVYNGCYELCKIYKMGFK